MADVLIVVLALLAFPAGLTVILRDLKEASDRHTERHTKPYFAMLGFNFALLALGLAIAARLGREHRVTLALMGVGAGWLRAWHRADTPARLLTADSQPSRPRGDRTNARRCPVSSNARPAGCSAPRAPA